ncbi:RagB/SusD family nutrient uptake outer membrane protein [Prolixibacteraceae bacterium JC049]|nr:RagB/SusD family nutrient uptake outer membrane protein [Prolixibacteraceae bacterium JC049]
MKKIYHIILMLCMLVSWTACDDYLDVTPDDIATVDHAFEDEFQAKKYLFTCYRYMPSIAHFSANPAMLGGDEFWLPDAWWVQSYKNTSFGIARGLQSPNKVLCNFYSHLYKGIRHCNIFISKIETVPNMESSEIKRWKAEATFLKAYYHFYLFRMYGPTPIIEENLPISAKPDNVKYYRQSVDKVINFIVDLLDKSIVDLPATIPNPTEEMGRITTSVAKALKARILLTAASPLFNGNTDVLHLTNNKGEKYFPEYDPNKWQLAADACLDAITTAEENGHALYTFNSAILNIDEVLQTKANLRFRVTERWNSEIIWGNSQDAGNSQNLQYWTQANFTTTLNATKQALGVTYNIAKEYYTKNGLPITEDKEWAGKDLLVLKKNTKNHEHYIDEGVSVPTLYYDREPRFYADLSFDRSLWYWTSLNEGANNKYIVKCRKSELSGAQTIWEYNPTGIWCKKVCHPNNSFGTNSYSRISYAFPVIRLADLYLAYAEALNEISGPNQTVYDYINKIRERAGIPDVLTSYEMYSNNPAKPKSKDGLREIIHQERLLELTFEGRRFWDIRRWKKCKDYLNHKVYGWNTNVKDRDEYNTLTYMGDRVFKQKNYFWPYSNDHLSLNENIDQNPGW